MPLPTIGTYTEYVYPVCPDWPSGLEPNTAEDAAYLQGWGTQINKSPCKWIHTDALNHTLPPGPSTTPIVIRVKIGSPRAKEAQKHLQYVFCMTHQKFAKKLYLRETSWIEYVRLSLKTWWDYSYEVVELPNGYKPHKLVAIRKNFIATMRKMW